MHYINEDKMPQKAKRKAKKVSKEEFLRFMQEEAKKEAEEYGDEINEDDSEDMLYYLVKYNVEIDHDINIAFDTENFTTSIEDCFGDNIVREPLLGFHELDNGFMFWGFEAGGDWEYPVFGIVYHDGKRLRGYIPLCGNTVNTDFMCAFGSEEFEYLSRDEQDEYLKKYKKYSFDEDEVRKTDGASKLYAMKYGLKYESKDFGFNWELIEQDIKTFIQVVD